MPAAWLIPILAAVAGGATTAGLGAALAPKPQAPKEGPLALSTTKAAAQPQTDIMSDDLLLQYLASMGGPRKGV